MLMDVDGRSICSSATLGSTINKWGYQVIMGGLMDMDLPLLLRMAVGHKPIIPKQELSALKSCRNQGC